MVSALATQKSVDLRTRVEWVETVIVDLPLRRVQQFARFGTTKQSTIVIRVASDAGVVGVGEAITPCGPWWSGDSVESMKATLDRYLAPLLIGEPALDVNRLTSRLDRVVRGNEFAKAGIEMALLDLVGKVLGVPVHTLLGGKFRDSLAVAWPLATGDVSQELAEAGEMLASGKAGAFKLKMGALPFERDMDRAVTIARELAGRARLRVDPNESWDEATTMRALGRLEDAGVELIEQPVARWNLDAMARINRQSRTVIMIDEGVQTKHDMIEVIKRAAAGLVSLKIMKTGGIRAARVMADMAAAAGVPVYLGTFLETSIGTAANMQLAASIESLPYGGEVIGPLLLDDDLCVENAQYRDHALWLPAGPGLGITLDEARVKALSRAAPHRTHQANQ